jgi:RNA polymerase sigma factor (sigma-70 family)
MTARTPDDERLGSLMRATQAGDSDAYLLLLQEITPRLRQVVARRVGSAAASVEDLVQDVLLSVHVARASYDASRPFLPWLMAIARNRLADGARRNARRAAHEIAVGNLDVTFADLATNSSAEELGDVQALRHAMQALPAKQRNAIELLKVGGLSLKEAAAATGMTVGALKVATHRGLAALRRILAVTKTDGH